MYRVFLGDLGLPSCAGFGLKAGLGQALGHDGTITLVGGTDRLPGRADDAQD